MATIKDRELTDFEKEILEILATYKEHIEDLELRVAALEKFTIGRSRLIVPGEPEPMH